jgi:hypothetical protein
MLYREIIAVCSEIHTKYINTLCGQNVEFLTSGYRRDVVEICALLGYYAMSCRNCLPTFQDNVSVPSSGVRAQEKKKEKRWDRYVVPKRPHDIA